MSSSSTLAEIQSAYDDNASYAEDGSVAKCKAFITAVRMLIRRTAQRVDSGATASSITIDMKQYRDEIIDARAWLSGHSDVSDGGSGARYFSVEDFRS